MDLLTNKMVEQLLMMMMMIFGLDLSKNIFFGIQKPTYLLDFQKIKPRKANFIVPLVGKIPLVEK